MKKKYKDIIWNKWGWLGAVAGFLIIVYTLLTEKNCNNPTGCGIFNGIIIQLQHFWTGILHLTDGMQTIIPITLTLIIGGFIIGLVLNKLWRKFK